MRLNQLFFIICSFFALGCLGGLCIQTARLDASIQNWYRFTLTMYHFCWYLVLIFYINLTKTIRPLWRTYMLLAIPISFLIVFVWLRMPYSITYFTRNGIRYALYYNNPLFKILKLFNLLTFFYLLLSGILLVMAYRRSEQNKVRREIFIILIAQSLSIVLAYLDHLISYNRHGIHSSRMPGFMLFYSLLWISGIWISLIRYRFMAVTPAMISQDILSNIDECVVLLDADQKIISINNGTSVLADVHRNLINSHISGLIDPFETIAGEIEDLKQGKVHDFACRLNFACGNNDPVLMDVKFKRIADKYHDFAGLLLVAKEVKEVKQLQDIYRITNREAGIIQSVMAGKTNRQISTELNITERTVKSHLTHIFNKLAIDNRVQLIMLLKQFNLIPSKQADKVIFRRS